MTKRRAGRGCLTILAAIAVLIGMALVVVVIQGRRTPAGRPDYVALGSSFAAGAGLGSLQPGSPWLCARSVNGYPQQLARMTGLSIVDMSCGGAVTANVLDGGQFFQGPQIRVIGPETRLVTLTVGGNDIGYIGDLSLLAARHTDTVFGRLVRLFWHGPRDRAGRDLATLRADLLATLHQIHRQAPDATIVVATYPAIVPATGTCSQIGLSEQEAAAMRQVGDELAAATRSAATAGGALVVDMHAIGAGHNACAPEPWTYGWANAASAPFHPTLAGARATAEAILEALRANTASRQSERRVDHP